MLGAKAKTKFEGRKGRKAAKHASIKSFGHAGALIRKVARQSVKRSAAPAEAGDPPHTRKGKLKRAILYAVEKDSVVIGPDVGVVGTSASAHEFGGHYKREQYPKRPFMGPALEKVKARLPKSWANSVKA